ncbi:armadillo-type protein [Xylariomycetidae sp. FL2044]|nr:armadillo-type protein [Xylariomycetidae sp. FL2044]
MEPTRIPTTLPEVEHLINELYKPNPAETISHIQEVLQRLQKSPQGWQLAQGLLARPGDNVKFFGALTIIVKLNTERVPGQDALSVLQNLITWLITSLGDGSGAIVVRKLCSALVTYFIQYSDTWPGCIRHLLTCLESGASVPVDSIDDAAPIELLLQNLSVDRYCVALWFAGALAEETEKIDFKSTKHIGLHVSVRSNAEPATILMAHALKADNSSAPLASQKESILCLSAWIHYASHSPNQTFIQSLQMLIQPLMSRLLVDDLYEPTVELLIDLLSMWHAFFTRDHFNSLYALFQTEWAQQRYQALLKGDFDFDSVQFGLFMLSFGDAQMVEMMDSADERAQSFLAGLCGLLTADGYPVAEDKIFVPALEFWSSFVESLVDTLYSDSTDNIPWDKSPLSQVMQVVSHSWRKIQYPPADVYNSWESTERTGFGEARNDVADLLQSVYTISGSALISFFANLLLQASSEPAWAELEAACFCLGALSDCIPEGTSCDDILTKVFSSPLFDLLRQGQSVVPVRARQTGLYLIERYSDYFGRHAENLPGALNLLFGAVGDRQLSMPSSKSIYTLCSSCRTILTSEVDAFLEQYASLRNHQHLESLAEERVVGAISSIIQAVPDEARKIHAFQRLLAVISADVDTCLRLKSLDEDTLLDNTDPLVWRAWELYEQPTGPAATASDTSIELAIRAARCLCNAAKGFQAPVDLDFEDDTGTSISEAMQQTQSNVMSVLVRLKDGFSGFSEVVDSLCGVLRAGFSETESGPFVFPPPMVAGFITSSWETRIATVVNTASAFASSLNTGRHKKYIGETLQTLLPWVFGLLSRLSGPEADPELSQYGIEFAQRVMSRQPEILMSQPADVLEFIFMFSIRLLDGSEPLPKGAAAEFWTTFFTLKTDDQNTRAMVDSAMAHLGPQVCQSLMQNIGGRAARSELDKLGDPLKKLVVQHVHASRWLEAALNDPAFPSDKVSAEDKSLFLKKVISLRGSRATNQVIRDFWLACRGSNFAYAS